MRTNSKFEICNIRYFYLGNRYYFNIMKKILTIALSRIIFDGIDKIYEINFCVSANQWMKNIMYQFDMEHVMDITLSKSIIGG